MSVKVDKAWNGTANQTISDDDGNVWNISALIERSKDLEVFDMPMNHLNFNSSIGNMKIRDFVAHMKNILEVDMSCPIILDQDGGLFDGRHRIARALLEGHDAIKAVRFESDPPPTFRRDEK